MVIERIDHELCNGCGICIDTCSMDVIRMDEQSKKAVIKYPDECMCCAFCEYECPEEAIYVSPFRYAPIAQGWW
jgi:NAD-dependent dihydropyrimidine dehydrogenase PreA subunit